VTLIIVLLAGIGALMLAMVFSLAFISADDSDGVDEAVHQVWNEAVNAVQEGGLDGRADRTAHHRRAGPHRGD
jgi:hypothetical protein